MSQNSKTNWHKNRQTKILQNNNKIKAKPKIPWIQQNSHWKARTVKRKSKLKYPGHLAGIHHGPDQPLLLDGSFWVTKGRLTCALPVRLTRALPVLWAFKTSALYLHNWGSFQLQTSGQGDISHCVEIPSTVTAWRRVLIVMESVEPSIKPRWPRQWPHLTPNCQ